MWLVVILTKSLENLVVPIKWVKSLNVTELIKGGVNSLEIQTVFYSPKDEPADFNLQRDQLDYNENSRGCFKARIHKFYGKRVKNIVNFFFLNSFKFILLFFDKIHITVEHIKQIMFTFI